MARKTRQTEAKAGKTRKRRRRVSSEEGAKAPDKEQGFRFDEYWDEAFAAYFDPTLRTCCQIRY